MLYHILDKIKMEIRNKSDIFRKENKKNGRHYKKNK